ncbi:DNA-directed DNA polymerase [Synchytrium microbalum]|uniref:DNA-directed DNA polymerase n=1 Tax=Synchytrium microbalum TaxID=1806994 RepID=A0A507BFZ2_9FUNG|nr:DNA-directed DNA polymerase [Synchytrium microbalum]TPX30010.1 DNA-directed DNA polymerase [Synchytrium microbalum]
MTSTIVNMKDSLSFPEFKGIEGEMKYDDFAVTIHGMLKKYTNYYSILVNSSLRPATEVASASSGTITQSQWDEADAIIYSALSKALCNNRNVMPRITELTKSSIASAKSMYSHEIWTILKEFYSPKDGSNLLLKLSEWMGVKQNSMSIDLYGQRVVALNRDVIDIVSSLEEKDIGSVIQLMSSLVFINGLNESMQTFKSVALSSDKPKLDHIITQAKREERLREATQPHEGTDNGAYPAAESRGRGRGRNFTRGRGDRGRGRGRDDNRLPRDDSKWCTLHEVSGHDLASCVTHKRNQEQGKSATDKPDNRQARAYPAVELAYTSTSGSTTWIMDSGATSHMTDNRMLFHTYQSITPRPIMGIGSHTINAIGIGHIRANVVSSDTVAPINLVDVLHVPGLHRNLLSARKLVESSQKDVVFKPGGIVTLNPSNTLTSVSIKGDGPLYEIEIQPLVTAFAATTHNIWHARLGHASASRMKATSHIVNSEINTASHSYLCSCTGCVLAKHHRSPFPQQSPHRAKKPFDIIHTDVAGPMDETTIGGNKYFVTFIDDCTRYVWIYCIKTKSQVHSTLENWLKLVQTQFERTVKCLHSDNGGEYINKAMLKSLRLNGMVHRVTTPYTPQQNGVAERYNRTIMEASDSMRFHAGLPIEFWGEATMTACYINNRLATDALAKQTPHEALFAEKPDISHLKVFGCIAWPLIPSSTRRKRQEKSTPCLFMGYDGADGRGIAGVRLWNLTKSRMDYSRDVYFWETKFLRDIDSTIASPTISEPTTPEPMTSEHSDTEHPSPTNDDIIDATDTLASDDDFQSAHGSPTVTRSRHKKLGGELLKGVSKLAIEADEWVLMADYSIFDGEWSLAANDESTPNTYKQAIKSSDSDDWMEAMIEEMSNMKANHVFELVDLPSGTKPIPTRWVYAKKQNKHGVTVRYRSRLVAKGFLQREGVDMGETYSPTLQMASARMIMDIAAKLDLELHQMDVVTAFLQCPIDTEVYINQPEGFVDPKRPKAVLRLRRGIYGLKQSPRLWNQTYSAALVKLGYKQLRTDPCVWIRRRKDNLTILGVFVDDTLLAGNTQAITEAKRELHHAFKMTDQGQLNFFLGMEIVRDRKARTISLNQRQYLKEMLQEFRMDDCNPTNIPWQHGQYLPPRTQLEEPWDLHLYRKAVGSLLYASNMTRPDIAAAVAHAGQYMGHLGPSKKHWAAVLQIFSYIKGTLDYSLVLGGLHQQIELLAYADADYANDQYGRRSRSGYTVSLGMGPICWGSKKQQSVVNSTTEAEYVALGYATQEVLWARQFLKELGFALKKPTIIFEDNRGAWHLARTDSVNSRTKHIDIRHHFIRDYHASGDIEVTQVSSTDNVADIFTKGLPLPAFQKCRKGLALMEARGGVRA